MLNLSNLISFLFNSFNKLFGLYNSCNVLSCCITPNKYWTSNLIKSSVYGGLIIVISVDLFNKIKLVDSIC